MCSAKPQGLFGGLLPEIYHSVKEAALREDTHNASIGVKAVQWKSKVFPSAFKIFLCTFIGCCMACDSSYSGI